MGKYKMFLDDELSAMPTSYVERDIRTRHKRVDDWEFGRTDLGEPRTDRSRPKRRTKRSRKYGSRRDYQA